jgi:hypothetical protein
MASQKSLLQLERNTHDTPHCRTGELIPCLIRKLGANDRNRYTAMPADALKVFESVRKEEDKIWSSVVPKNARASGSQGAAPQATGLGLYAHGAIAAVVGAVAVAL